MRSCYLCGEVHDPIKDNLRPYGMNFQDICYDCGHSSPELIKLVHANAMATLDMAVAASPIGKVKLTQEGPKPAYGGTDEIPV